MQKSKSTKLWSKKDSTNNDLLDEFNSSINVDKRLWEEDIFGQKEHAKMLCEIGILTKSELELILKGLEEIVLDIKKGSFSFDLCLEDIHTAIEFALVEKIGDAGKRLHTGRSRNDQVALDFKLYCLRQNDEIVNLLTNLLETLNKIAKNNTKTLMPGYTHLQHAQPITLAFYICAYSFSFIRDIKRLQSTRQRNDDCPLGSAAFAGSVYGNKREELARNLGFSHASYNAMDSVSQRDFALDLGYDIAVIFMHISRLAEELILWSSSEFGFISFSANYSTGSSIMPQKKNPDVAELLRGKVGRAFGNIITLFSVMKGLPMAYNKDMQEDKECIFDSIDNIKLSLKILNESLKELSFNTKNMLEATKKGHLNATDLADYLVANHNIPFRESYKIVGECVELCDKLEVDLSVIDTNLLANILPKDINHKKLQESISLFACVEKRTTIGGSATIRVLEQIEQIDEFIKAFKCLNK